MPWSEADAGAHTKRANTPKRRRLWRNVANNRLRSNLDKGMGKEAAEASAIRQANAVVARLK